MKYEIVDRGIWDHNGTLRRVEVAAPWPVTKRDVDSARRAAKRVLEGARSSRHVGTRYIGPREDSSGYTVVLIFDVSRLENLR